MSQMWTKSALPVHKLYSTCPPLARTQARCLPLHWSIVPSKTYCSRPHQTSMSCRFSSSTFHTMDLSLVDTMLGCLEATGWTQDTLAFLDAAVQLLHVRGAVCRCTVLLNTKSLLDTLRIVCSNMTSLWRREAVSKKSVKAITRISCFVTTMKLLQIYLTVSVKKCTRLHFSR